MWVEQLGSGEPEVAVLGAVHGDEPCGVRAIERLIEERPTVAEPVKLVIANELAFQEGARYVDEDLNRAFPGDPEANAHERRLAAALEDELADCLTFSMHSTQSHAEPFAIVGDVDQTAREIVPQLPVTALVETGRYREGRLFTQVDSIEAECGLQGSDAAAENADRLTRAFLTATGVLPGDTVERDLEIYRLTDRITKDRADRYEVFVDNFTRVEAGETFAAADGSEHVAEEPFYPVLMSSNGYPNVFGYAAEQEGVLQNSATGD